VILDIGHPTVIAALPALHKSMFSGVSFTTVSDAYEDVFGRVPLALMSDQWVIQNMSRHDFYDGLKRVLDIAVGLAGLLASLVVYPFVALAIRLEGAGPIFIAQERVGQYNKPITLYKFRSMERNDSSLSADKAQNRITRVGAILRKSRVDELPQLFNVVRGDVSLIGPRPELPSGVELYDREISYYSLRYLIKPGLSGWAQLYHDAHPHHVADIEATREKLSYDFYYMKHRSLVIDVLIVLKTMRKLAMQSGA
jgi:lipopolysaccharide/colanic/teichoic acid biosynthesis glycosyltransferase